MGDIRHVGDLAVIAPWLARPHTKAFHYRKRMAPITQQHGHSLACPSVLLAEAESGMSEPGRLSLAVLSSVSPDQSLKSSLS